MKTSRNSTCPCGSGRKYKNCCEQKEAQAAPATLKTNASTWIFGILGALALFALAVTLGPFGKSAAPASTGVTTAPLNVGPTGTAGSPQPPGPAPAGKVWSTEHGHWHDAPGTQGLPSASSQTIAPQPAASATYTPQPPGPTPEGKVWSAEHGHWHDIN